VVSIYTINILSNCIFIHFINKNHGSSAVRKRVFRENDVIFKYFLELLLKKQHLGRSSNVRIEMELCTIFDEFNNLSITNF
jgi:hypothetical protein